jgi:hypothetical protein
MKLIDTGYDELLNSNYELYSVKYQDLKEIARSWYGDINFREFDERDIKYNRDLPVNVTKQSGLICNLFFAYIEGDKYYLLDGFNRLLTNYCPMESNPTVYLKVLTDELKSHEIMRVMAFLNMWKLSGIDNYQYGRQVSNFFDRGMKLLLYIKFGIEFYVNEKQVDMEKEGYTRKQSDKRWHNYNDMNIIDYYFKNENECSGSFYFSYDSILKILSNIHIIDDLKDIIKSYNYEHQPFPHYKTFLEGYCMFLANRRARLDETPYKFETYVNLLKEDNKFFKKLQGMSGNDSTRKNIFTWFRNLKVN